MVCPVPKIVDTCYATVAANPSTGQTAVVVWLRSLVNYRHAFPLMLADLSLSVSFRSSFDEARRLMDGIENAPCRFRYGVSGMFVPTEEWIASAERAGLRGLKLAEETSRDRPKDLAPRLSPFLSASARQFEVCEPAAERGRSTPLEALIKGSPGADPDDPLALAFYWGLAVGFLSPPVKPVTGATRAEVERAVQSYL